ncbi:MAG: hypothetical protein ABJN69_16390 [Hellea sp.]
MSGLAKWTLQGVIICTLLCSAVLSGCSSQFSEEVARKNFDKLGGTELILEVDMAAVAEQELMSVKDIVRHAFRDNNRLRTEIIHIEGDAVLVQLRDSEDMSRATGILNTLNFEQAATQFFSGETLSVSAVAQKEFRLVLTEDYIDHLKDSLTERSVDVIRRRNKLIDGPRLSVEFLENDQIRLLVPTSAQKENVHHIFRRRGNLSFHIVREESNNVAAMKLAEGKGMVPPGAVYYPDAQGGGLIVERRTQITGDCVKAASAGLHPASNYPIVNFSFNLKCAQLFGSFTQKNIGKRFAVVLDDVIITAPRINGPIMGGSGFIEGNFTLESAKELARLLNSGPLPARFKTIKETTIKPKL